MDLNLAEQIKAFARVHVGRDGTGATIWLNPPPGFGEIPREEIRKILASHDIRSGILDEGLLAIEEQSRCGVSPIGPILIARARPPTPGRDGSVDISFQRPLRAGAMRQDGRMDYRERGWVREVRKGEVLARVIPPVKGQSGLDIFGKEIPAQEGKPALLPRCGPNVDYDERRREFVARQRGHAHVHRNEISVTTELVIPGNVDFSTGNIDFDGDLVIRGSIRDGFKVSATRNVTVTGEVRPRAQIVAGGEVSVTGLLNTGRTGGLVKAGGKVTVESVQSSVIFAAGDVEVRGSMVDSHVSSLGEIRVLCPTAEVRGCNLEAVNGLTLQNVGSESGTRNTLIAGVHWTSATRLARVEERVKRTREQIEHLRHMAEGNHTDDRMEGPGATKGAQGTPARKPPISRARRALADSERRKLERRLGELEKERAEAAQGCREKSDAAILVEGTLYPVCSIRILDAEILLEKDTQSGVMYVREEGKLVPRRIPPSHRRKGISVGGFAGSSNPPGRRGPVR